MFDVKIAPSVKLFDQSLFGGRYPAVISRLNVKLDKHGYINLTQPINSYLASQVIDTWLSESFQIAEGIAEDEGIAIFDLTGYGKVHPSFVDIFIVMAQVKMDDSDYLLDGYIETVWKDLQGNEKMVEL